MSGNEQTITPPLNDKYAPMRARAVVWVVLLGVAGCTGNEVRSEYVAYLDALSQQRADEQAKLSAISDTAKSCAGDARCVEHVAAVAALAQAGARTQAPEQYRPQPSLAGQIALGLVGQIAPLAGAAVSWHQSDTAARTAQAQYNYLDHVISRAVDGASNASISASASMATVAAGAQPNITVGGDYVSGAATVVRGQIGDSAGGDQISGHVGDAIGQDRIDNSGLINTGGIDHYQSPTSNVDDHQISCAAPPC